MRMVVQRDEEAFVELECGWVELTQMPHRFDELSIERHGSRE